jgi:hypothetical protein
MTTETENCSVLGCWRVAIASLEAHPLCRKHFIDCSEVELEAHQHRLKENHLGDVSAETARRFVQQCLPQADNIERSATDLDDLDRERLINLIFHAAELGAICGEAREQSPPLRYRYAPKNLDSGGRKRQKRD